MKIVIASDHGGFAYKTLLIPFIEALGHTVTDLGCRNEDAADYSDYAIPAAKAVAASEYDRGIVLCGTGIGVSVSANKVRGVRCALCGDLLTARLTREHNDTNMLALGARIIGIETAKAIVETWLATAFSNAERHQKRIDKIGAFERGTTD